MNDRFSIASSGWTLETSKWADCMLELSVMVIHEESVEV